MQEKQSKKRKQRGYTAADLTEVWDRWGRGECSTAIGRVL